MSPFTFCSCDRMLRILDAGLLGQHARDLLQRRRRGLEGVEELRDLLHRLEEDPQIQQERRQRAERHLALQHPVTAVQQHHSGGDVADQPDARHEDGQQLEGPLVDGLVLVGDVFEDLLVARLAAVRLDRLDAGHGLDELHDHQRGALAHLQVRLRRLSAEPPHQQHQDGEGAQAHQAQPDVEHDEQHRRATQRQDRGDETVEPGLQHVLDGLDVIGRAGDHPAGGVAVVEGDVEPLEVPKQPAAQLE